MKRLALAAAAVMGAGLLAPAALAVTSGTVTAQTTVTYSCDMTLPGSALTMLKINNNRYSVTDSAVPYSQNADTTYTWSAVSLTLVPSGNTTTVGTLQFSDDTSTVIAEATTTAGTGTGNKLGADASDGEIDAFIEDPTLGSLETGSYTLEGTLTCTEL